MKQRYLAGKMNGPNEKGDGHHEEVTMETLGKKCKAGSFFFFFNHQSFNFFLTLVLIP